MHDRALFNGLAVAVAIAPAVVVAITVVAVAPDILKARDRVPTVISSLLVALVISLVCYTTMVNETLCAEEVFTMAICADKLDSLAVRSLRNTRTSVSLGLGVPAC